VKLGISPAEDGAVPIGWNKDYAAGALIACIGAFAGTARPELPDGELTRVGPGFFRCLIGVLMILVAR